jgi:hypothetical protein
VLSQPDARQVLPSTASLVGKGFHCIYYLSGMLQTEQHQVMGVVLAWLDGVVLQEVHVEAWVWKAVTDWDKPSIVFIIRLVVKTPPWCIIPRMDNKKGNKDRGLAWELGQGTQLCLQERQTNSK